MPDAHGRFGKRRRWSCRQIDRHEIWRIFPPGSLKFTCFIAASWEGHGELSREIATGGLQLWSSMWLPQLLFTEPFHQLWEPLIPFIIGIYRVASVFLIGPWLTAKCYVYFCFFSWVGWGSQRWIAQVHMENGWAGFRPRCAWCTILITTAPFLNIVWTSRHICSQAHACKACSILQLEPHTNCGCPS